MIPIVSTTRASAWGVLLCLIGLPLGSAASPGPALAMLRGPHHETAGASDLAGESSSSEPEDAATGTEEAASLRQEIAALRAALDANTWAIRELQDRLDNARETDDRQRTKLRDTLAELEGRLEQTRDMLESTSAERASGLESIRQELGLADETNAQLIERILDLERQIGALVDEQDRGEVLARTPPSTEASVALPQEIRQRSGIPAWTREATRLREGPSTSDEVISALPGATPIAVLAQEGSWHRVVIERVGWVAKGFLAFDAANESSGFTTDRVNLRGAPNLDGKPLQTLPLQTPLAILETTEGWFRVRVEQQGWIFAPLVSFAPLLGEPDEG